MTPKKNMREIRAFIGIVNYYRGVWSKRSHLIHPLTALTSNKESLNVKTSNIKRLMKLNE